MKLTESDHKASNSPDGSITAPPSKVKRSPRSVIHAKAANLALKGEKYTDIAHQIGANPKYPRQGVYRMLQSNTAQSIIAEKQRELSEVYTAEKCLAELDQALALGYDRKNVPGVVAAILGKAKVSGLLIDRIQTIEEVKPLDTLEADASDSLSSLTVSPDGIETDKQAVIPDK